MRKKTANKTNKGLHLMELVIKILIIEKLIERN